MLKCSKCKLTEYNSAAVVQSSAGIYCCLCNIGMYCYLCMQGTSTDVSRFAGQFEHVFETTVAGVMIQAPQVCGPLCFIATVIN